MDARKWRFWSSDQFLHIEDVAEEGLFWTEEGIAQCALVYFFATRAVILGYESYHGESCRPELRGF